MFDDLTFLLEDLPSSVSSFVSSGIAYFLMLLAASYLFRFGAAYLLKYMRKVAAYVRNARTYYGNRNGGTD